jgi:hypothetical protein
MSVISFEPIEWYQEIRDYPNVSVGRHLMVNCKPTHKPTHNVLLDGKYDLREFTPTQFQILDGGWTAEDVEREKYRLSKEALGGVWYHDGFVYGWFYLKKPDSFTAVWDQVRNGGYSECTITLGVEGRIDYHSDHDLIWNTDQPLSIESVSLCFKRTINIPKP